MLAIADSSGQITEAYAGSGHDQSSWQGAGLTTQAQSYNPRKWQTDDTWGGIQQFRNRAYDPATGTWIQEDPMGVAGGVNVYQFNNGNPVSFGDPFGLCVPVNVCLAAAGAVIGGVGQVASNFFNDRPLGQGVGQAVGVGAAVGLTLGLAAPAITAGSAVTAARAAPIAGRATSGLQRQLDSHRKKLESFKMDPDKFDNKGFLRGASPELRKKIIDGRVRNLEKQIETFVDQIKKAGGGG